MTEHKSSGMRSLGYIVGAIKSLFSAPAPRKAPTIRSGNSTPGPHDNAVPSETCRTPDRTQTPQHDQRLSAWWPASVGGSIAFVLLLVATAGGGTMRAGPEAGLISAVVWYALVILIRYFAVIRPSRR